MLKFSRLIPILLIMLSVLTILPLLPVYPVEAYAGEPGARSQMASGELFLGGNYIELGISAWGDFGTVNSKPAGFYATSDSRIGMSVDYDGFNNTISMPIDFFLPGDPEERFAVGYKVGSNTYPKSNCALNGSHDMPTVITDQSSGDLLQANIVSTWTGTMEITQVVSFTVNQKFFRNEVTIKNISGTAWDGARYMRSFDPDNTVYAGGSYTTDNMVTHTIAEDGKAVVRAQTFSDSDPIYVAFSTRAPIFFYSTDPSAVASAFGFTNTDPYYSMAYDSPRSKGENWRQDGGITINFDSGPLANGESKTFIYYTSLDERDFEEVEEEIETTYTLTYTAGIGGSITGEAVQTVVEGEDGSPVTASPDQGYQFEKWSDGSTDNPRQDTNIKADINVEASFVKVYIKPEKPWEGMNEAPTVGNPANISVRSVWTAQQTAYTNQPVVIYANASNNGDLPGAYTAVMKLNGETKESRDIIVQGNAAAPLQFTVTCAEPGAYEVDINGQKIYFNVVGTQKSADSKTIPYTILGILVAVAITLGVLFVMRRGFAR